MKKLVLAIALLTAINSFSQQVEPTKPTFDPIQKATKMSEKLKATLNLNDQQYAAVLKLNTQKTTERAKKMKVMFEKRVAERNAYNAEMKKILTPEQFATFEQKMNERRERGGFRKMHLHHKNS